MTRTLAILIFDDVEVLDFCGPFEVFSVASRFTDPPAFNVLTVAENTGPVATRGGLSVSPHHRLLDCPQPGVLLVPGGQGTRKEMHNAALIEWVGRASEKAELVLSVCTGALLLAKAGLLDGLQATTRHGAIDLLRQMAPCQRREAACNAACNTNRLNLPIPVSSRLATLFRVCATSQVLRGTCRKMSGVVLK
jgi:transcriptional regulator GlxA family with amidase domain